MLETETKSQFAARLGVSKGRVSQWVNEGMPLTTSGQVPVDRALEWVRSRAPQPGRYADRGIHRLADGTGATGGEEGEVAASPPPVTIGVRAGKSLPVGGGKTVEVYLRARAAKMVSDAKRAETEAHRAAVELRARKGELVDRARATGHVFRLAREERDAWLNWPARVSALMAAELGVDAQELHVTLEKNVREHLAQLGKVRLAIGRGEGSDDGG